jgi:hypothetical protein
MAANDGNEHWWRGDECVHAISSTAEKAIAAIESRQTGGAPESIEQIMARPYRMRHRMPDYTGCGKAFTRCSANADEESPFPGEHDPPGLVERVELWFRDAHRQLISKIRVEWYTTAHHFYGAEEDPVPELRIPWDAWGALAHCTDLLEHLGQSGDPAMQPDAFIDLLRNAGFEDLDAVLDH